MEPTKIALKCEKFGETTHGFALRRDLTRGERGLRAGKVVGILWVVAAFTIFIPILHFILPPLLLLGGIGFGITTWMENGMMLGGEIPCPSCKKPIVLPQETESWPYACRCPSCHTDLSIQAASEGK
ncbi:MAG: hypothetical protein KF799_05190 [Bdellovibrionales bacterium]|nr:hypothetical protein [Bdellovibrionales bacterium]